MRKALKSQSLLPVPRPVVGVASWLLATYMGGCAHFSSIDAFPASFRERLARHPVWLTVTSFDNPPGTFPPAETSVIKKWESSKAPDGAVLLKETYTSSFVGVLDAIQRGERVEREVDVGAAVDPTEFFPFDGHALERRRRFAADRYEFADVDGKRFQIRINGKGRIIFMPAPNNSFVANNPFDVRDIGIWTTPFGAESELVAYLQKALKRTREGKDKDSQDPFALPELGGGYFLHHDITLKRRLPIVLDRSFPPALRPAVVRAAAHWDKALGHPTFEVSPEAATIETADCLSGRKLCLRWIGPPELALTGANGYTELAFDPQTGLVVGGIISVINDDVKPPFAPLPAGELEKFKRLDRDFIADAMLRYNDMNDVQHPEPERYAEYLVLHEMGHFSGLGHNFYTSDATTPERPVTTIMSYPPFPVAHRATYVGDADKARLAIVYRQKKPTEKELTYCSTFDAMAPERDERGYYIKSSQCDIFTVGSPAAWYIQLAERGQRGVFTPFPDMSHLSEELQEVYRDLAAQRRVPPLNVLSRLGFLLADPRPTNAGSRRRIEAYLCARPVGRVEIAAQLKTYHDVTLRCGALVSEDKEKL